MCQVPYKGMPDLPSAKQIELNAAANENESFQLVLTSNSDSGMDDLAWKFPVLQGDKQNVPASAFSCRKVEFINVKEAKDPRQIGMIADPLIEAPALWSLKKERNTAFFITVKVPAGTPKGLYKGVIQLYSLRELTQRTSAFGAPMTT